jgi:DNA-binding IclR family transcriptional regulator
MGGARADTTPMIAPVAGMQGGALRALIDHEREQPKDVLTSVSRALDVLETIAASPMPIPAKAVARKLEISLGTSYHVLHTLEHAGYVVRVGHGCYGLGSKVARLHRLFYEQFDLVPTTRPVLADLADESGEDCYIAVFRGGEMIIVDVADGTDHALHIPDVDVGFSRFAHSTALGKVLLAAAPDEMLDDYLGGRRLEAYTRRTLVERRHLKRNLGAVRELGVGKDLEELSDGCCCVAVPVYGPHRGAVAAIGLSCPSERWRHDHELLTALVHDAGVQASSAMGGEVPEVV